MHDAAYKDLFSRPRMVEDLLRGFAAREWSDALDLSTLEKLPAEYVSDDLRRRHGDVVWRVRFRDRKWLYLLVMLEFQSTTDRYMAVRILVYTGLPYQDLIRRKALGRRRAAAPGAAECCTTDAPAGPPRSGRRWLPSSRRSATSCLTRGDGGRTIDLPRRNLAAALIALENSGSAERLSELLAALSDWLRDSEDDELRRAFVEWVRQAALRGRFPGVARPVARALEGGGAMLAESVKEWTEQWFREGREQGLERGPERGRAEERALLCRQAARKFDAETAARLAGLLDRLTDPERLAEVGEWIIECGTGPELIDRAGQ